MIQYEKCAVQTATESSYDHIYHLLVNVTSILFSIVSLFIQE